MILTGCSVYLNESYPGNIDIQPDMEGIRRDEITTALFYGFDDGYGSELIAQALLKVEVGPGQHRDDAVIEALAQEPAGYRLFAVINPKTRLISAEEDKGILYVTLSSEFIEADSELPANWDKDPEWVEYKHFKQRLAVYCVVNSLLSLGGNYTGVQILLPGPGGEAYSPTYQALGFVGEGNENRLVEPMSFFEDVVQGPAAAVRLMLTALADGQYESVLNMLTLERSGISAGELEEDIRAGGYKLYAFDILDTVYDRGKALVTVSCDDNHPVSNRKITLTLHEEDGVWKVEYDSFAEIF